MLEYQRVEWFESFCKLEDYAGEGWELVAIEPATWLRNAIYVFKRNKS